MTDEQWVWLFVNQQIDAEEQLEKMCDKCRDEVSSDNKCIRCGKPIDRDDDDEFINPNFDEERFNKLKHDDESPSYEEDLDVGLYKQVKGSGTVVQSKNRD